MNIDNFNFKRSSFLDNKTQSSLPAAFPLVGPRFQFKFTNTNTHTDTDTHNMHMRKEAIGGTQATTGNYAHKYNIDVFSHVKILASSESS